MCFTARCSSQYYYVQSIDLILQVFEVASGKMVTLLLPDNGIRNISTKLLESNSCVLSKDSTYAIAGVRFVQAVCF